MNFTNIEIAVQKYLSEVKPDTRYTSFDYCYNYFRLTEDLKADIEKSCLHLAFYLASWGMYRGSSFLLQKNAKYLQPMIEFIDSLDNSFWEIDVDSYNEESMQSIIQVYEEIKNLIVPRKSTHVTLITKILLGVFGFIPAFDNFFCTTFRKVFEGECGFRAVNKDSLFYIRKFYEKNKELIDRLSRKTYTTDFRTGEKTDVQYPKAKIIDMYGFIKGKQ